MESLEMKIAEIISVKMSMLNRPDLFREPLVAFSSAHDERYISLKKTIGDWHLGPVELLPDAQSVVSYFVPFTKSVISDPRKEKDAYVLWGEAYKIINKYFDHVNEAISSYLVDLGFSVKTIQATHTYDPKVLKSIWSHRSAAAIAGLGTFGANRMLITEKGSGGRYCSVITSATLIGKQSHRHNKKCIFIKDGSCGACFKICPTHALSEDGFDKFACFAELIKNENDLKETKRMNEADVCGKCISICPMAFIE